MTQLATPKRHRWTRSEYYRMADMGFFLDKRVELVGGEVIEMAAQKDLHVVGVALAEKAAAAAFGAGYWPRTQAPLNLGVHDDPEPDLAVVIGSARDYIGSKNRVDPLLVIEVSDTTLRHDRVKKVRRYARAGIRDYWIVNLVDHQLEVYRNPHRSGLHFTYDPALVFFRGQSIAPLAAPQSQIRVDDLLP
jgi:Uma2 family endonuclease